MLLVTNENMGLCLYMMPGYHIYNPLAGMYRNAWYGPSNGHTVPYDLLKLGKKPSFTRARLFDKIVKNEFKLFSRFLGNVKMHKFLSYAIDIPYLAENIFLNVNILGNRSN